MVMVCQSSCRKASTKCVPHCLTFASALPTHGFGSVIRFQRWVECLSPPLKQNTFARFIRNDMPPIDVWMVLHAYLLNPQSATIPPVENPQSDFIYPMKVLRRRLHPPSIAKTSCNAHRFTSELLFRSLGEQLTSTFHLYVYEN